MKETTRILKCRFVYNKKMTACLGIITFLIALSVGQAQAFMFKTANPDLKVSFDNTLTYSAMYRLSNQDPALLVTSSDSLHDKSNNDDGDRNFNKGIVMNRLDLYSEFDLSYRKFGVRLSGAAYYDTVYNKKNDNDSPETINQLSVPHDEFTDETVELHGKNVELMEAFTFGAVYFGNSELTYKAGQYGLWWGTSFFFGDNGVAGGMGPVNLAKGATLPNMMMRDLLIPVPQASATLQVNSSLSFGAYYQFKWKPNRFFGVGSYFSPVDLFDNNGGGDRIITGPGMQFTRDRSQDMDAKDSGQFGVQVQYQTPVGVDLGAYYIRYHDKMPQVYNNFSDFPPEVGPPAFDRYWLVYPENIQAYAISANTSINIWTIGAEVTYRTNVPLVSSSQSKAPFMPGQTGDNDENPHYPVGKSLHANINFFMPNLPSTVIYDKADLIFEVGYNRRMSIDKNAEALDPSKKKYGLKMQMVFEPKWFQFLPAFDLITPVGFSYAPEGRSSVQSTGVHKGGSWNIGIGGTYDNKWDVLLTYVNYYGSTAYQYVGDTDYQAHADRDYVGFTLRKAF